ncbi:MAG: NAD(P)H-hydrate dehydratase [Daejeonella sp.]
MLNLLTSSQIRDADAHTIATKPLSSFDLMESAARAFVTEFKKEFPDKNIPLTIFCGTGNNGGDGLAIARLLKQEDCTHIYVKIVRFSSKSTKNFDANLTSLKNTDIPVAELLREEDLSSEHPGLIIDALLGSGINKPVEGFLKSIIEHINNSEKKVISVDIPSGFFSDGIIDNQDVVIRANLTISFQRPKINFFFPESAAALKRFKVVPIGLDEDYIESVPVQWKLIGEADIRDILKARKPFSHKGSYGHALIISGNRETMGAALLCADACLHSGAGLTTACIPESGLTALNTRSPEVMALIRDEGLVKEKLENYASIAFGPGTGTDPDSVNLFKDILSRQKVPMVVDADGLSILSENTELFSALGATSVLTPHMKEFDRMFGEHQSWWERVETARKKARELGIIILLKNQYSFVVLPDGDVLINPTGNPAMATGGMGDVLTGMIAGFLAQGYSAKEATMLGCYLHGEAGDELKEEGMNNIPPRYLIERLPYLIDTYLNGKSPSRTLHKSYPGKAKL